MNNHALSNARRAREDSRRKVGSAIRRARRAAGLSLASFSERVGLTSSTISKIENGRQAISFERLERVASSLGCSTVELIDAREASAPAILRCRRSITDVDDGPRTASDKDLRRILAADLLNKSFLPVVIDILSDDLRDHGALTSHEGEEFNYVLEGAMDFHTEVYAPVRLPAGSSIYFDGQAKHARIRVGDAPCRILAVICAGLPRRS